MTIGYPWVLWGTLAAVAGVVAAHLLSVTRPPAMRLPTARFVPEQSVRAVSRATRPSDLWLLLVRVLLLGVIGVALAAVTLDGAREPVAMLLVVDGPRAPSDSGAWRAQVRRLAARDAGDAERAVPLLGIVAFDGVHAIAPDIAPDELSGVIDSLPAVRSGTTLAALLLRARRVASELTPAPDSVQLVVISPLMADIDAAGLEAISGTWPGRIVWVSLDTLRSIAAGETSASVTSSAGAEGARPTRAPVPVDVRADDDDVVHAAYALYGTGARGRTSGGTSGRTPVRVLRTAASRADSAFAEQGGALVVWDSAGWDAPNGQAVVASGVALVAPFARRPLASAAPVAVTIEGPTEGASADAPTTAPTHAIAWWNDGEVAALETPLGRGCLRQVGFSAPAGDVLLGDEARGVLATLAADCATVAALGQEAPLDAERVAGLAGDGALATVAALRGATGGHDDAVVLMSPLTRLLLLVAVALLGVESWMRARAAVAARRSSGAEREPRSMKAPGAVA